MHEVSVPSYPLTLPPTLPVSSLLPPSPFLPPSLSISAPSPHQGTHGRHITHDISHIKVRNVIRVTTLA
jgi:hypothetical protein